MIPSCDKDGHEDEDERPNHEVNARAEHEVDLAHIVRRARHDVAHALTTVEGEAFAQQAEVQLVARIASAVDEQMAKQKIPGVGLVGFSR